MSLRRAAPLLLLATILVAAVPHAWQRVRDVAQFARLPRAARGSAMNGPWYAEVQRLRPVLELDDEVTIVALADGDIGAAAFASAELFPLRTRLLVGMEELRAFATSNDRYVRRVLVSDHTAPHELRLSTYADLAAASLDDTTRAMVRTALEASTCRGATFVIPVAARGKGIESDDYFTALVLHNDGGEDVPVAVTFHAAESSAAAEKRIVLGGGETLRLWDPLRDLFAREDAAGWLEIHAQRDINVSAALVNRGRGVADAIVPQSPRCGARSFDAVIFDATSTRLRFVNRGASTASVAIDVTVNGVTNRERLALASRAQTAAPIAFPAMCTGCTARIVVDAPCDVVAIVSEKDHQRGGTRFTWPSEAAP